MSYRFIWKKIASKALSSAVAKGLLTINRQDLWEQVARTESLTPQQIEKLRGEIDEALRKVEAAGRQERDLVVKAARELVAQVIKGVKGP